MTVVILLQAVLWIWFLGCTVTWRFGGILLVDGMGVKSAEFAMLCLYTGAVAAYHCLHPAGRWILPGVLILWFSVQFACHWRYTLFGAGEQKLKGYNECFRGTARLIPESSTRLIPDLYHIVLHILILANIIVCLAAGQ